MARPAARRYGRQGSGGAEGNVGKGSRGRRGPGNLQPVSGSPLKKN